MVADGRARGKPGLEPGAPGPTITEHPDVDPSCTDCPGSLNFAAIRARPAGRLTGMVAEVPCMPTLRTPLYDWHAAHGARLVDFSLIDVPKAEITAHA